MNVANNNILNEVRALMPWKPIGLGEAKLVAERQAALLTKLLQITEVPVDLFRITEIPVVTIEMRPRYLMTNVAAYTRSTKHDKHTIIVTQNEPLTRRRFHLAHEIKHILDFGLADYVYAHLAVGNEAVRQELIEKQICDHFAASLLMPKSILRRAWASGIHDPEALADLFNVSKSAMIRQLRYWGFSDAAPKPAREYFKRVEPATNPPNWTDDDQAELTTNLRRVAQGVGV